MKHTILFLLCITAFCSCTEQAQKQEQKSSLPNELKIDIQTERLASDIVKVIVTSNFPDNTNFTINADRPYKRLNDTDDYGGKLHYLFNKPLVNGKIEFQFKVDDKPWIDQLNELRKISPETKGIKSIQDSIEIRVIYTPKGNESPNIQNILGVNGENVKGKGVEKTANFYTMTSIKKIQYKIIK